MIAYSSDGSWFDASDLMLIELPPIVALSEPDEIEDFIFSFIGRDQYASTFKKERVDIPVTRFQEKSQ